MKSCSACLHDHPSCLRPLWRTLQRAAAAFVPLSTSPKRRHECRRCTLIVDPVQYRLARDFHSRRKPSGGGNVQQGIRRPNYGNLEVEVTVDDPKTYTRPWSAKRYLKIALDTELIEDICNENERSFQHYGGQVSFNIVRGFRAWKKPGRPSRARGLPARH